jgi:hypothetical protein
VEGESEFAWRFAMSSVYYSELLWFSFNQHRGIAKLHGHEIKLSEAPVICGHTCECEYYPEVGCARIRQERSGWVDMEHDEIVDADRLLHDMIHD